jgi:hypothetical protein
LAQPKPQGQFDGFTDTDARSIEHWAKIVEKELSLLVFSYEHGGLGVAEVSTV